ncbi:MAG: hypothetical protein OEM38_11725 [Gammaproteobacteria bacterium]|nr:hypothetical protein [Gammaproteobacteria bacterium]
MTVDLEIKAQKEQMSPLYHGVIYGAIAAFIWCVFPVVRRQSIAHSLSAYDIAALRFLVAGPLLIPVLW